METKGELRHRILKLRDSLSAAERASRSKVIAERLMRLEAWRKGRVVFPYVSFRTEVETGWIIDEAMAQGKVVAVPYTDYDRRVIIPSRLVDAREDLAPRRFGLMEPKEESIRPVSHQDIDVVIVPGAVFDTGGGRIGYGMGFYDRFLPALRGHCLRVALAFEIQVIPVVPLDEHDCRMHMIITEERSISITA